jgi:hypothetical protein
VSNGRTKKHLTERGKEVSMSAASHLNHAPPEFELGLGSRVLAARLTRKRLRLPRWVPPELPDLLRCDRVTPKHTEENMRKRKGLKVS